MELYKQVFVDEILYQMFYQNIVSKTVIHTVFFISILERKVMVEIKENSEFIISSTHKR